MIIYTKLLEQVLNQILEAQVEEQLGARRYERTEERSEARICRESSLTQLFLDNMIVCPGRRPAGRIAGLTYHLSSDQVHLFYQRGIYTIIWT